MNRFIVQKKAFTLIELLIVIGLLGAMATLLMSTIRVDRRSVVEDSIVLKELADIQAAFQNFAADCALERHKNEKLNLVAQYGVTVLLENVGFDPWDGERQVGWRGPYLLSEGERKYNTETIGQIADSTKDPRQVILTPDAAAENDPHYYRIIAMGPDRMVRTPQSSDITQLWVVYPHWGNGEFPYHIIDGDHNEVPVDKRKFYRRLLLSE